MTQPDGPNRLYKADVAGSTPIPPTETYEPLATSSLPFEHVLPQMLGSAFVLLK
jgi:hypothetical protein